MNEKIVCEECDWAGTAEDLLSGISPFDGDVIYACPECKSIERFLPACEAEGCWAVATEGYMEVSCENGESAYHYTCDTHNPFRETSRVNGFDHA